MAESPRGRYASPSPRRYRSRSRSPRSPVRGYRGGSRDEIREVGNPGNNLYVTGLSTRVSEKDLEEHFSKEGKVLECRLVVDPRTRESRGFGFVTMDNLEDAERSIKYLNRSILEGRVITVEKAKRKRARTPTPGKYLGVRSSREITNPHDNHRRRGRDDSHDSARRSPRYSPYRGGREYPSGDYKRDRDRSYSPRTTPPRSSRYERERSRRSSSFTPSRSRSLSPGRYR